MILEDDVLTAILYVVHKDCLCSCVSPIAEARVDSHSERILLPFRTDPSGLEIMVFD